MYKKSIVLFSFVSLLGLVNSASAMELEYMLDPSGLPSPISNLSESTIDSGNVGGGDPCWVPPTAYNDGATYLAHDRNNSLGQTFTTTDAFSMGGFLFKNVAYTTNTSNGTWWYVNNDGGGAQLEVRIIDPALEGTAGFVVYDEDYTVTGTELGNELFPVDWAADKLGTGAWIYFKLGAEVPLLAGHTYGFDVTVTASSPMYFFESAGTVDDSYAVGLAFNSYYNRGTGEKSLYMDEIWDGDHTFIVVPEPATLALLGLGGLALIRKKRS